MIPVSHDAILNNALILEDERSYRDDLRPLFKSKDFKVTEKSSYKDFSVLMENKNVRYGIAIIDLHLGNDRPIGGMRAIEAIKMNHPETFVVLHSGRKLSPNLKKTCKADLIVPKTDSKNDFSQIYDKYFKYLRNSALFFDTSSLRVRPQDKNRAKEKEQMSDAEQERIVNLEAFQELLHDPAWYAKHEGKFVAIVDGKIIGEGDNRELLITNIKKDGKGRILIAKVEQEEAVHLLSPFHFQLD